MKNYCEPTLEITMFGSEEVMIHSQYADFMDTWLNVFKGEGF